MREISIITSAIAAIVLFVAAVGLGVALLPILIGVAILGIIGAYSNRRARRARRN